MTNRQADSESEMVVVRRLHDVFSTGKTPEATYTPRTGGDPNGLTFDQRLKDKAVRESGGVMLFGVSKSGKTSLVERILPESAACWLQGTRINTMDDFWRTLAQQLNVSDAYSAQISSDATRTEGDKFDVGLKPILSVGFDNSDKQSEGASHSWSYSGVSAQQVEDALTGVARPIVLDDFHHVDPDLRVEIAKAIKPLLRKTFIVLVAIPSHSFDPAKTVADIGGRMTQFKIPDWTVDELTAIADKGFRQLNVTDPGNELAKLLANCSFGSPHIMQELCYAFLSKGLKVTETVKSKIAWIPGDAEQILEDTATESEPFAFQAILAGRNTKGEGRKDIRLKDGGITDSYGITLLAIKGLIPPIVLRFKTIRQSVSDLTRESIAKERVVAALIGMAAVAEKNKGGADPIFSYRDEVAYIEDPLLAFFLKYGRWRQHAVREPGKYTGEPERPLF
ncbi:MULTISPECIES: hypothetical protein [unclassified Mycolicibacterium]|uniref:hypothetical protein n=1 Tax=unclassified Mycolicibacterium TaxID=2636767 RepID=UPI0012DF0095|nr:MULTISPECIES: hypothetical protein [unclassified Mycolicibacterium]MUL82067.1 hypothetical protein [Mycolicibacterium sp. CBMA 329]MUL87833.1 hypothetical protein [Mycolicibacterium sp. CBMA 331]MUM01657.1 hypothetical protein [Mycolicibacterium sp. CBMA 334]MUM25511.1 hypothetical protein [Mycolicibacterium sp. CBMA 295]MUM38130.1 hypothetical protein [Mycolicibacterium sp. CBMA 247]